jgi:hypothetical protein
VSDGTSYAGGAFTNQLCVGYNDGITTATKIYGTANIPGSGVNLQGITDATMTQGHATLFQPTFFKATNSNAQAIYSDQVSSLQTFISFPVYPTTTSLTRLWIGANSAGSGSDFPAVDVAYAAVLKEPLNETEVAQLLQFAQTRWGVW